jgi:thiol-disulfide isomerase/thioredoxin
MKKSILVVIVMLVLGIMFVGCGKKEDAEQAPAKRPGVTGKIGDEAAALTGLQWLKGAEVTFQPGQVYVVEFWATWCPPCLVSIPHLTKLQEEYKGKVTIIGISVDKDQQGNANKLDVVKQFVADQGDKMEYTVAYESSGDVIKAYSKAFGERGIPHAFIVDQTGKIAWVGYPMSMDDALEGIVEGE